MSTLAERIHRACPNRCRDESDPPAFMPSIPVPCKWEGHAIAGEQEKADHVAQEVVVAQSDEIRHLTAQVAALTAKVSEGHSANCDCHHAAPVRADVDGKCIKNMGGLLCGLPVTQDLHTQERCVEWRRK